jgi:hypothetical protein
MRTVLAKALQVLGALACLLALVFGLGLTPSGYGSALWEILLLAFGVALLLGGAAVARR